MLYRRGGFISETQPEDSHVFGLSRSDGCEQALSSIERAPGVVVRNVVHRCSMRILVPNLVDEFIDPCALPTAQLRTPEPIIPELV
jgi:hypothetical protein